MFKKLLLTMLVLTLCLGFASCGGESETDKLKAMVTTLEGQIATLQGQLGGLSNYDDAELLSQIAGLQSQLSQLSNYNDADLKARLLTLEQQVADLQSQLDGSKIYSVGDTVTVYNNGFKLFEITYVSKNTATKQMSFTIKNISMFGLEVDDYMRLVSYCSADNYSSNYPSISTTILYPGEECNFVKLYSYDLTYDWDYMYFGLPIGAGKRILPYAIFKV